MVCALQLEDAGFQVMEAYSGAEAMELASASPPSVVVLDWMLPDLDGLEVLARLRDDDRTAGVPVVMVTARAHERDQLAAWEAGVNDYLVKPFEANALVSAVNAAADHRIPQARDRRRRALERLDGERDRHAQLVAVFESAPDAIVIVDADGRIGLVNQQAEALFGHERARLIGRRVGRLLPALRGGLASAQHEAATNLDGPEGGRRTIETTARRRDGSEFPAEITLTSLDVGEGRTVAAFVRDVTERKWAEQAQALAHEREREATARLREVDRMRSDFLSTVSHELRTPLTAIKGFAEWLDGNWDAATEERKRQIVQRILNAGGRLDLLIQDLLDFSRLERGLLKVDVAPQPLGAMLRETLSHVGAALEKHTLALELDDDGLVLADASATVRVVENLLTNAAKFSPAGSTIHVTTAPAEDPDFVVLSVRDEGIGIHPSEQAKVFDRFYRIAETSDRPGTGIGLAIVKQFVEAQGGSVSLCSQAGEGSEFLVRLRRAPTPEVTPDAAAEAAREVAPEAT